MQKNYMPKCRYYAQGRCAFGNNCKFSHQGFQQLYLLRHAQSLFNSFSDKQDRTSFTSQKAKQTFQLNQQLIDCGLTQKGLKQAKNVEVPSDLYRLKKKKVQNQVVDIKVIDVVFVSPLNRALETAHLVLKNNKIKIKNIIVLPELSQVLSKICDFSDSIQQKKLKYNKFDFSQIINLETQMRSKGCFWQDILLDKQFRHKIHHQQKHGKRYMKILDSIFPTPLQNSQNCFNRSMIALQKIQRISKQLDAKKILVVSHNRILKYMTGRDNNGRAPSFQNCQFKKILLQEI